VYLKICAAKNEQKRNAIMRANRCETLTELTKRVASFTDNQLLTSVNNTTFKKNCVREVCKLSTSLPTSIND
jgi:hypothetical protein